MYGNNAARIGAAMLSVLAARFWRNIAMAIGEPTSAGWAAEVFSPLPRYAVISDIRTDWRNR